jgi:hypothetical protein
MGLLDDAIREHLELKRSHGADPTEVERQEREALGAPRHGEFASPAGEAQQQPVDAEQQLVDAEAPPVDAEAPAAPEPEPEAEAEPEGQAGDAWFDDERDEVPATETLEHPQPAAAADPEGEDVLEETPEFLQETPEHERLWFEQRPPRDFDWDK